MQAEHKPQSFHFSDDERETIAAWRNGVIIFYSVIAIVLGAILIFGTSGNISVIGASNQ